MRGQWAVSADLPLYQKVVTLVAYIAKNIGTYG